MPATSTPTPTVSAASCQIVRPYDPRGRWALARLAYLTGAQIHAGRITLAGVQHPALLATRGGSTLAALLIDDGDETRAAYHAQGGVPTP